MNIDKFTYKTEFQSRGAAHVHGTLWVKLHKIEKLRKLKDGRLVSPKQFGKEKSQEGHTQPFVGIGKSLH